MATLGASPQWPSKLKSGKSSSSLLWWKTLIGLLPRICTIWMIPFEEYLFDISFHLFSLQQLKASWWLKLVKFSFTNILVFDIPIPDPLKLLSFLVLYRICLQYFNSPISRWSFLNYLWTFLCDGNLLHRYGKFECRQL